MTVTTPTHLPAGEGIHHRMIDGDHVTKATLEDAEGSFELFEIVAPAAAPMAPLHVSPWSAALYLVEGRVTAHVGDATYDVEPGGVVVFPAGTPSTFQVLGESARFVGVTTGTRAGRFFADMAAVVPADRPVEEAFPAILEVTQRYGISVAGG